jgi:hypothetical protein
MNGRVWFKGVWLECTPCLAAKFWDKSEPAEACWEWQGPINYSGYGQFFVCRAAKGLRAHRFAFAAAYREDVGEKDNICHTCDNRRCVKPLHLYKGTHQENMRDRNGRGRSARLRGALNGHSKITTAEAERIRSQYENRTKFHWGMRALAREFGVNTSTIWNIAAGRTWL